MRELTRRQFMAAAGAAAASIPAAARLVEHAGRGSAEQRAPVTVVFQGDSITDGRRVRTVAEPNVPHGLGTGYPLLVAAALMRQEPDPAWRFFNRGVSGDRVPELEARWDEDTIALRPDVLTVLVGVNDYWHTKLRNYTGTAEDYENGYVALLERTRRELPSVRLVVLEPFVLPVGFVDDSWFPGFDERRAAAARVAKRMSAVWIPLQAQFGRLSAATGPAYWAADGVHPSPAGHEVIAQAVVAALAGG